MPFENSNGPANRRSRLWSKNIFVGNTFGDYSPTETSVSLGTRGSLVRNGSLGMDSGIGIGRCMLGVGVWWHGKLAEMGQELG